MVTNKLKVTEGDFQLSLLGRCKQLVRKCYGCQQLMKVEYTGNFTPPAPPDDLVVISVMRRTFYKNCERMIGNSGTSIFTAETSAFNVYSQPFCLFSSLSRTSEIRGRLLEVHKQYLRQVGQIVLGNFL